MSPNAGVLKKFHIIFKFNGYEKDKFQKTGAQNSEKNVRELE
jgi:hypothetical protein